MKKYTDVFQPRVATTSKTASIRLSFGGKEFLFRFSVLAVTIFKDMFGKDIRDAKTGTDVFNYLYSAYLAGCRYDNIEPELTVKEFINLLDDYPGQFVELAEAYTASQRVN